MIEQINAHAKPNRRKRNRGKKNKKDSNLRAPHGNLKKFLLILEMNLGENEEIKVHPKIVDPTILCRKHMTAEELKAEDNFIATLKQVKADQDFDNQTVMSDIDEERYYGNTEYKLKLTHTSSERLVRLTTQMKFRVQEGTGEAFYVIGVGDKGEATGITNEDMEASLRNLHKMATTLSADITILTANKGRNGEVVKVRIV